MQSAPALSCPVPELMLALVAADLKACSNIALCACASDRQAAHKATSVHALCTAQITASISSGTLLCQLTWTRLQGNSPHLQDSSSRESLMHCRKTGKWSPS